MVASAVPDDRTLEMVRTFDAPPERVFAAWTDPVQLLDWFGPPGMRNTHCRLDLRVGGGWELTAEGRGTTRALSGRYLAIDPPRLLAFTWAWHEAGSLDTPREHETVVTLAFRSVGHRTEMTLTQTRFRDADGAARHRWGWTGTFERLDAFLRQHGDHPEGGDNG
ncbi:SRPBCC family protein [Reyranella sp.]|uniref:SRPBCC family protein n=1 Tax=Reyranella sp. TaxID=1929291 RepID=UPI003BA85F70